MSKPNAKRAAKHAVFKAKQLAQKAELDAIWSASHNKCAECGKSVMRTGAPNPHIAGYVKDGCILCGDHFFPPGAIHEPPDLKAIRWDNILNPR